jgi:hypothetical protein
MVFTIDKRIQGKSVLYPGMLPSASHVKRFRAISKAHVEKKVAVQQQHTSDNKEAELHRQLRRFLLPICRCRIHSSLAIISPPPHRLVNGPGASSRL